MRAVKRAPRPTAQRLVVALALVALPIAAPLAWTLSGGDARTERVIVTGVVDGDTIHVDRGWRKRTVRLKGIDTPETVHPEKPVQFYGPEAAAFTRRSLTGKWVRLEVDPRDEIDAYGRLLAYVHLDGTLFNRELIRLGYARAYSRFPSRYAEDFARAQAEARSAGIGLWAEPAGADRLAEDAIIANRRSRVYHLPGQENYGAVSAGNRVYFRSEEDAVRAGYRRARR